ncbi:MAG: CCA tRNA nucleotidyltransferase [Bacillota bacterium]|nr:CCA tRNA nucleotidyltransferase [Bacillota bacterium]
MDILQKLDYDNLYIINELKKIAVKQNINIYLVGGAVRDSLLGIPVKDLDFCLDRDPDEILDLLPFDEFSYNKEFKTAKARYKDKIIDLILMRKEYYKYSGALPKVEKAGLYDDLFRRDFTINSLAYDIKNNKIIDYFSGIDDIINKKIRKIHINSYNEDGTRIFRGIKYKVRYDFIYEDEEEIKKEIRSHFLSLLSNDRIVKEILLLIKEDKWADQVLELSYLKIVDIDIDKFNESYSFLNLENHEDRLIKLILCIKDIEILNYFIDNSIINKKLRKAVSNFAEKEILKKLILCSSNYQIYSVLNRLTAYDFKFLMSDDKVLYKVINFNKNLLSFSSSLSGQDLELLGYKGKEIGDIIKRDLKFRLNTLV